MFPDSSRGVQNPQMPFSYASAALMPCWGYAIQPLKPKNRACSTPQGVLPTIPVTAF
jgi:hypothetical protein